jgi:tetratricopeptide (TPR) repeat protein/serine/threonine protein kinase
LPETVLTSPAAPEPPEAAGTPESPVPEAVTPPPATAEGLPAQIGRYHLEGEIAQGGVGIVLRAHDSAFQRSLAVKVLLARHRGKADVARRFLEEAQVMGQLQHPGIPPVYDLGALPDGRPYFALKLIKGQTLAALLKERQRPADDLPRLLAIFGQVCQTIAYAHSRGILHRDLKPSNIMVGAFGEVQVMDWGLAKVLGSERKSATAIQSEEMSTIATVRTAEDDLLTQEGAVMGTPAYMAPEQARGEIERLDERADVFGLGAILCVLLTGKPPYVAPTKAEVYRQAKEAAVTDAYARLEACGADAELVQLAKACLTPELAERPRHAGLVAEAVTAHQARVQARLRQAEVARAQAEVKVQEERKRRRVTVAAVVVVLLGGSVAGWWYQQQAAEQQRRLGEAQQGLKASLSEASKLREAGLKQVDNPPAWGSTLAAAWTALEHARTLLAQEPDLAETSLAQQAQQAQAQLEADRKDWQLLTVFDQVRLEQSQWDLQRRDFKLAETYPRLKKALADFGLAIGGLKPGEAAARLRQRPETVQPHVRAVLEECLARAPKGEVRTKQWLVAVLSVDADPWLKQFRQAVAKHAWAKVEQLAGQAEVVHYHPAVLVGLARNLPDAARAGKVLLLRRAQQQYPGDFWVNFDLSSELYGSVFGRGRTERPARAEELPVVNEAVAFLRVAVGLRPGNAAAHNNLGLALQAKGALSGAIACYQKALALEPKYALTHFNLGVLLQRQGDLKGAIACYRKGLALDPKFALAHYNLGNALADQGEVKGAMACYQKALDLDPKLVQAHTNLGAALQAQGDVKGAIACYQKALEFDPKDAPAHLNLGAALANQGDLKGAIACYKKALQLDPTDALIHNNLGASLADQGDVKGAIACFHKALALDPKNAKTHYNLGNALYEQGEVKGAIACYRKALDLDPKLVKAHYSFGIALYDQGDLKGAIACYKKALKLDPKLVQAHGALGQALLAQGAFPEARAATQQALKLLPKDHSLRPRVTRQLQECQRLLDLDARLTAIRAGDDQPKDTAEQLALADLCQRYKKRYAAAARFYQGAFAAKPKLTPAQQAFFRYNAACAAALAAAGQGEDASKLDAKEKTRLRQQALTWLRDNLKQCVKQLEDADAKTRKAVQQTLQHWQKGPDFDSVRGKEALAQLPAAERAAWQEFWDEVQTLLKKTQQSTK